LRAVEGGGEPKEGMAMEMDEARWSWHHQGCLQIEKSKDRRQGFALELSPTRSPEEKRGQLNSYSRLEVGTLDLVLVLGVNLKVGH